MLYIIICFIILVIIEYFWFKYINDNKEEFFKYGNEKALKLLQYNKEHEEEIIQLFKDTMNERLDLLKHMDYNEWLEYSQKNFIVELNGNKYYIFIYEQVGLSNQFILRSSVQEELLNYDFRIERDLSVHKYITLEQFPPGEFLPQEMYNLDLHKDGFNRIAHTWENPFVKIPVKKECIITKFHKDNFNGVLGIGYPTQDLSAQYGDFYYNLINKYGLLFFNMAILIIAIVLYVIDHNIIKTIIVLFLGWFLLMYQLTLTGGITDIALETANLRDITSSVLGVSFLVTVNTFIIKSFDEKKLLSSKNGIILKNEITFLFCISLIFLLFSLYKENNFKSAYQMRSIRIINQLNFNFCIFYNVMICFIFLFFNFNKAIMKKR